MEINPKAIEDGWLLTFVYESDTVPGAMGHADQVFIGSMMDAAKMAVAGKRILRNCDRKRSAETAAREGFDVITNLIELLADA
jgi:hypothetical protein